MKLKKDSMIKGSRQKRMQIQIRKDFFAGNDNATYAVLQARNYHLFWIYHTDPGQRRPYSPLSDNAKPFDGVTCRLFGQLGHI